MEEDECYREREELYRKGSAEDNEECCKERGAF